jgi:small-conductance mechanosensitive channel
LVITIRIGRDTDIEAASELALKVAKENGEEKAITGCFLTKVDATAMTLELRLHASDSSHRDTLRSKLIGELARRFAGAHLGAVGAEAATFA